MAFVYVSIKVSDIRNECVRLHFSQSLHFVFSLMQGSLHIGAVDHPATASIEPGLVVLLPEAATSPGQQPCTAGRGTVLMSRRKLTVKGQGPDARTTFYLEAYKGKVWITSYDCPFTCEAIMELTQADSLVELINQTIKEAREYRKGPAS